MKLRVDPKMLADAVTTAAKALPNRPTVPVLAGVLLTASETKLMVSGFDYETSHRLTADATVADTGAALVSGRLLASIAQSLPNKPVDIASAGTHLELVCGSSRFTLPTMPVEDYPSLPSLPEPVGSIDAAVFAQAVQRAAVAAGRDETLPTMTGVRVEIRGTTMSLLATDRYRLAAIDTAWQPVDPDISVDALVPARILADTAKALAGAGQLHLSVNPDADGLIGFTAATHKTTSRLLDATNYPPVRSLFPKPEAVATDVVVDVAPLADAVKRVALVAERTTPVLLTFDGDVATVEAGGTEEARGSETLDPDTAAFRGRPITIGFNPQYLLDGLLNLGAPTAHFAFVDAFKPAVMSPADGEFAGRPDHRYLIMPIRVSR